MTEKTSVRNTTRLTVVESDVRSGNVSEGNRGITVGVKIDKVVSAFASAPPKSFILNRTSDRKNATARDNAVVTNTLVGSYIIDLQKDRTQPLIHAVNQSSFGAEPVLTSNQEAYAKNRKQSIIEK
nr:hypothetical protein [Candidatus Njordarchaeum guaymaensis]